MAAAQGLVLIRIAYTNLLGRRLKSVGEDGRCTVAAPATESLELLDGIAEGD